MIHVDWNSKTGSCESLIRAHCENEIRQNFKSLLGAICQRSDITLIFLEEFNIKAKELEKELEELRNGKNDSSD